MFLCKGLTSLQSRRQNQTEYTGQDTENEEEVEGGTQVEEGAQEAYA